MRKLICVLFFLFWNCTVSAKEQPYINSVAPQPALNYFTSVGRTQITYTNGDVKNPEILILVCDLRSRGMELQYSIFRDGYQVLSADYFTIQRYPAGYLKMTAPYYPPSIVIYDSGMGYSDKLFARTIGALTEEGNWGFVFTFESVVPGLGAVTKAWTEIIPGSVFQKSLSNVNLSACTNIQSRSVVPLIRMSK